MAVAFANYDEPHAWLIRGLVEYGWPDVTPVGGRLPPGRHGGIELARFRDSTGRDGVHLLVPAVAGGMLCSEDGVYDFSVRMFRRDGAWFAGVRCVECNYLQEFPYDPQNPLYLAGYVHQAVLAYVPQFVQWRLQGNELTWAQRKGLPEIQGEACSGLLGNFIDEMVRTRRGMDTGPTEGWWIGKSGAPPPPSGHAGAGPVQPGAAPAAWAGGTIATVGQAGGGGVSPVDQAKKRVALASRALTGASTALVVVGAVSMINALLTIVLFQLDRPAALAGSGCFGVALLSLGGVSIVGARKLGRLEKSILPWVAVGTNLALPLLLGLSMLGVDLMCCAATGPLLLCVPVAIYALVSMVDPDVVKARDQLALAGR